MTRSIVAPKGHASSGGPLPMVPTAGALAMALAGVVAVAPPDDRRARRIQT